MLSLALKAFRNPLCKVRAQQFQENIEPTNSLYQEDFCGLPFPTPQRPNTSEKLMKSENPTITDKGEVLRTAGNSRSCTNFRNLHEWGRKTESTIWGQEDWKSVLHILDSMFLTEVGVFAVSCKFLKFVSSRSETTSGETGRGMCIGGHARDKQKASKVGSAALRRALRQEARRKEQDAWPYRNAVSCGLSDEPIGASSVEWESARAVQAGWRGSISQRGPADRRAFPGSRRREGRRSA